MQGELAYKDRHGRVWMITEAPDFVHTNWSAETLDQGHTDEYFHVGSDIELLLGVLDAEEYRIDRASFPLETGAPGGEITPTGSQSEPTRDSVAFGNEGQIDGRSFEGSEAPKGPEGREQ